MIIKFINMEDNTKSRKSNMFYKIVRILGLKAKQLAQNDFGR